MALVIEDGTGKPNADSYVGVTSADTYALRRRITAWGGLTEEDKESALIQGFDAISQLYGRRFMGRRTNPAQAGVWPREGAYVEGRDIASTTVPEAVKSAQIELAIESIKPGGLWASVDPNEPQLIERTVGPVTRKFKPRDPNAPTQKTFDKVEAMLAPYFDEEYMSLTVYRA